MSASWAQRRLWFIGQLEGGSEAYHIPIAVRLHGALVRTAMQSALKALIQRHETLRTTFRDVGGEPVQVISQDVNYEYRFCDLQSLTVIERDAQISKLIHHDLTARFDLSTGPLLRALLLRLNESEHLLLFVMHHIVSDAWSMSILARELCTLYDAFVNGQSLSLPPLPIQYADYAQWQRQYLAGEQLQRQLVYWQEHLQGAPNLLQLPTDRPRPAAQTYRGANVEISLSPNLTARLKALSRQLNLTLAMTLHGAWSILLSKLTGQEDIVVGIPVANRRRTEVEGLIGFFVNTLAVRVRLDCDPRVSELLQRTKQALLGAYSNQDAPFERVVEATHPTRSLGHSPVFQVMFALQNAPRGVFELCGLRLTEEEVPLQAAKFDLVLILHESDDGISGRLNYALDLFDRTTIDRWSRCFEALLNSIVNGPQLRLSELSWFDNDQRRQVIELFNSTQVFYPQDELVQQLFEHQVDRSPHAVAVTSGNHAITYATLNLRANRLAHTLICHGVYPDQRVAVYMERSVDMIVVLLGILKAGGAYVPLDPNYPIERLEYILRDSRPTVLVTHTDMKSMLPRCEAPTIFVDMTEGGLAASSNPDPIKLTLRSSNLVYVIYTSGSTGQPKGVAVEHRNLANLVRWHCAAFHVHPESRCSCLAAVGFDAAVWEIWPPLTVGATTTLAPSDAARDAEKLISWWRSQLLDVSFLPTPMAEFVFNRGIEHDTRQTLLVGGDRLHYRPHTPSLQLVNNYGPTECSVVATSGRINSDVLHIGRPISNTRIYILDRVMRPLPVGIVGEMYIGGAAVSRGYLNRSDITSERFLTDPFVDNPHARMYKTGDLARWLTDGTIEYLGRNDFQVKIRGFRVELEEIEAQLSRHTQIKEVVVIVREDRGGEDAIVGYVVPRDPSTAKGDLNSDFLRAHLKSVMPAYMIPNAFVVLDSLPLTPHGKVDRHALPAPRITDYVTREFESPLGEVEEILAGIWQTLLNVERVGRRDNFFELGGHSLLIVQMVERLRRVGLFANVRNVFENATLAELASTLTDEAFAHVEIPPNLIPTGCRAISPEMLRLASLTSDHIARIQQSVPGGAANIQDIYPLVPLQEGLLFHHLVDEQTGDAYVLPTVLCVPSRERLEELIAALQSVVNRHDILRTAILWEQLPQAMQVVYRQATLPVETRTLEPDREPIEQIREWVRPERLRLDIQQAPLMKLQIAADNHTARWFIIVQMHHITTDHISLAIVISEVVAYLEGRAQQLPISIPYRNHVAQALAYARAHDSKEFFRRKLADINEPTAPFGLLNVHSDGTHVAEEYRELDDLLTQRVRTQARRLSVSSATLFHAAWGLVVAHTSGRSDVVFGSVLLGRLHGNAGEQQILGMFINTLPLRLQIADKTTLELVEQTQRELVELLTHEQASLAVAQRCSGLSGSTPLFTALFNYRHGVRNPNAKWSSAAGVQVLALQERTNYPITLSVDDFEAGFKIKAQTDSRIDPQIVVSYLCMAMESLLKALEKSPQTPALSLPILPQSERSQVELLNATQVSYPENELVHRLFEAQVNRVPDAVATVHQGCSLTYAELNRRANQLARQLINCGVIPNQPVGICVERSNEMVVGLLGILKCGAAYLPLDPFYPPERLAYMIKDASPRVVLIEGKMKSVLPAGIRGILLNTTIQEIVHHADDNLSVSKLGLSASQLVYTIYTSGSTGQPKATCMPHRAMINLLEWHREHMPLDDGERVLQFAALSFDVAFQETFSTLCAGGTLVLLDEWVRRDPHALMDLLRAQNIQRLFLPPLMLQALAEYSQSASVHPDGLRDIVTAGEQLRISPEIVTLFQRHNGAKLHNHYGPTETHVVTTLTLSGNPDTWPTLPTIGRPIANTRIHILDARRETAPLGVIGEIYIGGANVAQGYLDRPALTSERFVADPYGVTPQTRMYKTGDLGKWLSDGTIEYLGRNDDQVKIRGYRIELREIEAQLMLHKHIRDAAVTARKNTLGAQDLVAYVTPSADGVPIIDDLRTYLKSILPEYMLPRAFMILSSLPLTPNGKLDRRALPPPTQDAYLEQTYEAPLGEVEEKLARVWQKILQVERVSRLDNFFDLGGHSLLALKMLLEVNITFGASIKVKDVYKYPTVQDLAACIYGGKIEEALVDLRCEAVLDGDLVPAPGFPRLPPKDILLTGATGFVGRFLLVQLLQDTDATIHCVVRAKSQRQAFQRLRATLCQWDLWRDEFGPRIVAIAGDLRLSRLGIERATYEKLCEIIDSVYHCATSMNHLETYAMARPANVESAGEIIRFATCGRSKLVNHISTLGIFTSSPVDTPRNVYEYSPVDQEKHLSSEGYIASKWVSEKLFLMAIDKGIPCNVFRLGLVWADAQHGRFDELQSVYRVLKSCLQSGLAIKSFSYPMPPTPVDYVARAISFLGNRPCYGRHVFHISSSSQKLASVFERCNEMLSKPLHLLSLFDWIHEIKRLHDRGQSLPAVPIFAYAFSMDRESFDHYRRSNRSAAYVKFDCTRTHRELKDADITAPELDDELLQLCLHDMIQRDPELRRLYCDNENPMFDERDARIAVGNAATALTDRKWLEKAAAADPP